MIIELQEIKKWIRKFNDCLPYCAQDLIVHHCFQCNSQDWDERCAILSLRIEALTSLFRATRVGDDTRHRLATESFAEYYWDMIDSNIGISTLSVDTTMFSRTLQKANESIGKREGASVSTSKISGPAVLISKLLHWSFPRALPMMDRNVLRALGLQENDIDKLDPESRYSHVMDCYTSLEQKLEPRDKDILEEFDYETQHKGLRKVRYSWIRVADKWLWLRGRKHEPNSVCNQPRTDKVSG